MRFTDPELLLECGRNNSTFINLIIVYTKLQFYKENENGDGPALSACPRIVIYIKRNLTGWSHHLHIVDKLEV